MDKFAFYKAMWKQQPGLSIFITGVFLFGGILLILASWKVFFGVMFILWSQNLEKYINGLIKLPEEDKEDVHT